MACSGNGGGGGGSAEQESDHAADDEEEAALAGYDTAAATAAAAAVLPVDSIPDAAVGVRRLGLPLPPCKRDDDEEDEDEEAAAEEEQDAASPPPPPPLLVERCKATLGLDMRDIEGLNSNSKATDLENSRRAVLRLPRRLSTGAGQSAVQSESEREKWREREQEKHYQTGRRKVAGANDSSRRMMSIKKEVSEKIVFVSCMSSLKHGSNK